MFTLWAPYDVQVDCVLCNCQPVIQPVSVNVVRVHDGLRTPDCTQCNHVWKASAQENIFSSRWPKNG